MKTARISTWMWIAALTAGAAWAQDRDQERDRVRDPASAEHPAQPPAPATVQAQTQLRDRDIYGSQLMTRQERQAFRSRMQSAKTQEERERIRAEHHKQMVERAKARGVTLPADPPAQGGGMGPGGGMGMGVGAGGGAGRGR